LLGVRDAFHVPCIAAVSSGYVRAGNSVKFIDGGSGIVTCNTSERHGIVDPFASTIVSPGQVFWVFVDPNLVKSLRHHFEVEGLPVVEKDEVEDTNASRVKELEEKVEELEEEVKRLSDDDSDDGCRGCY